MHSSTFQWRTISTAGSHGPMSLHLLFTSIMESTKVQTLGELSMHGTANGWARLLAFTRILYQSKCTCIDVIKMRLYVCQDIQVCILCSCNQYHSHVGCEQKHVIHSMELKYSLVFCIRKQTINYDILCILKVNFGVVYVSPVHPSTLCLLHLCSYIL